MPLPATNPPAIAQPFNQEQSQNQNQSSYNAQSSPDGSFRPADFAPSIDSSNTNNAGSNSESRATGNLNQEASQNNVQVNNSSLDSVYSFGSGLNRPTTSLSVTAYSHGGSDGVAATLFIPLGGGALKQHERLVNSRTRSVDLDNQTLEIRNQLELASACAKIAAANVSVDYSLFPALLPCKGVSVLQKTPPVQVLVPPVSVISPPVPKIVPPVQTVSPPSKKPALSKRRKFVKRHYIHKVCKCRIVTRRVCK